MTNPNPYTVSGAKVTDTPPAGAVCVLQDNGAVGPLGANASKALTYTCSFASKPSYGMLNNHATVTWRGDGCSSDSSASADAPFQFGTGSAGNPSTTHDSITVSDTFNGGTPTVLGTHERDDHVQGAQGHRRPDGRLRLHRRRQHRDVLASESQQHPGQLVVRHHARLRDRA